jgi:hypothetical protein
MLQELKVIFKDTQTNKEIILIFKEKENSDELDLEINLEKIDLEKAIKEKILIAGMFGLFMEILEDNSKSISVVNT